MDTSFVQQGHLAGSWRRGRPWAVTRSARVTVWIGVLRCGVVVKMLLGVLESPLAAPTAFRKSVLL
jgi:hypothetical protein